jgi:CheY-like chemotaxis protein
LVIDDDEMVAMSIKRLLSREYDVVVEHRPRDAVARVAGGERFSAIICDLMMPAMTGAEVHAELERIDAAQAKRMVLLTGGAFDEAFGEIVAKMQDRVVAKPFSHEILREAIARVTKPVSS